MDRIQQTKALGNQARLDILIWLKNPEHHFPHQVTAPPQEIGVCVTLFAQKLGLSQPTVSRHLEILKRAGFVVSTRVQSWSFFKRNQAGIDDYLEWLQGNL